MVWKSPSFKSIDGGWTTILSSRGSKSLYTVEILSEYTITVFV